jgi:hypothetical protein
MVRDIIDKRRFLFQSIMKGVTDSSRLVCELESNGRENGFWICSAGIVATDEELGPKNTSVFKIASHRSRDRGLASPWNASEPQEGLGIFGGVKSPFRNLAPNISSGFGMTKVLVLLCICSIGSSSCRKSFGKELLLSVIQPLRNYFVMDGIDNGALSFDFPVNGIDTLRVIDGGKCLRKLTSALITL